MKKRSKTLRSGNTSLEAGNPINPKKGMMMATIVTREAMRQAELFARYVLELGAKEVYLFGSVAREDDGNDIDMIIVVEKPLYEAFVAILDFRQRQDPHLKKDPARYKPLREEIAFFLLNVHRAHQRGFAGLNRQHPLDLFLFPPNWKRKLGRLESVFHSRDGLFVHRIVPETRRYIPASGGCRAYFEPLPAKVERPVPKEVYSSCCW